MKKLLVLLLMGLLISSPVSAKRESSSEDATSVLLYGKYNDTLVPVKVAADGSVGTGGGGAGGELSVVAADGYVYNDINTSQAQSIVTYNGNQYVAYYNSANKLALAKRAEGSNGDWTTVSYDGTGGRPNISIATNLDLHNSPALGIDSDGYLHVVYDMHTVPLNYRKSSSPEDITMLGSEISMLGTNEDEVTYPLFFKDKNTPHNLYFLFRDGASGGGDSYIYKYAAGGSTWALAPGTSSGAGTDGKVWGTYATNNAYISYPYVDSSNNAHFIFSWRDSEDHDVNYVRYDMAGGAFYKSTGAAQTIPITMANEETIDAATESADGLQPFQGRRNISVDSGGTIHVAYPKWGSVNNFGQIWYTQHPSGGAWSTPVQLTSTGDVYTDSTDPTQQTPVLMVDDSDNIYIVFKANSLTAGIAALKSTDGGTNWNLYSIYSGSLGYWKTNNQDYGQWDTNNKLSFLMSLTYERNVRNTRVPLYLFEWQPSRGYASQNPINGIWNYDDISLYSHNGNIFLDANRVYLSDQNIVYVQPGQDIATVISAATAGDIIVLGAGSWTLTSAISISKAITLRGQGYSPCKTTLTSSTADINLLNITASNVVVENLCITETGAGGTTSTSGTVYIDGTGTTVLSGIRLADLFISAIGTNHQRCVQALDAGGEMYNVTCIATSSTTSGNTSEARGFRSSNAATAEADTTWNIYGGSATTTCNSSGTTQASTPYAANESSSTTDAIVNIYGVKATALEGHTNCASNALLANGGADAIMNVYGATLSGADSDITQATSGVMNLYEASLVNNTTSGTITQLGTRRGGALVGMTATSPNTVKTGANTACNTTCAGSQCVYGVDDTDKLPLACDAATADTCVCMGP